MYELHLMRVKQLIMRWSKLPSLQGAVCPCIIAIYVTFGWRAITPEMEAGHLYQNHPNPNRSYHRWVSSTVPVCLDLCGYQHALPFSTYPTPRMYYTHSLGLWLPANCSHCLPCAPQACPSQYLLPAVPWPMPAAHLERCSHPPLPAEVLVHPEGGML